MLPCDVDVSLISRFVFFGRAQATIMSSLEDVTDVSADKAETAEGSGGITRALIEETVPFLRDPRPEIRYVNRPAACIFR